MIVPAAKERGPTPPRAVVLFPDDWAAYSPTLLRLVDLLSESFDVQAYVMDTGRIDNSVLDSRRYRLVHVPPAIAKAVRLTGTYRVFRSVALALAARREAKPGTQVVAVDADGSIAAMLLRRRFHMLSLEVGRHPVARRVVGRLADSITIQSPERLQYQFGRIEPSGPRIFYVQNAPEAGPRPRVRTPDPMRPELVYVGNLIPTHGLGAMLGLVRAWPESSLTLLGLAGPGGRDFIRRNADDLITNGRLRLVEEYVPDEAIRAFLERFDIGLCLYELGTSRFRRNFNYESSPAGKMFNYFSAGLPVVASDMIGLNPVSLHGAGVQVAHHRPDALRAACELILRDYGRFARCAYEAALHYDFRRAATPLLQYLGQCARLQG